MTGMEEFVSLFGKITLADVVKFLVAVGFLVLVFKKVKAYLSERIKIEKEKENRESEIFEKLNGYGNDITELKNCQETMRNEIDTINAMHQQTYAFLTEMKETMDKRDRSKLRDRLLQYFKLYTNKEKNPAQSWSKMESDSFWEMFAEYEENIVDRTKESYMYSVVQPAMLQLTIIDI